MLNKKLSGFILFIIIFTLISVQYHFAQAPDTLWIKKYGGVDQDHGRYVQQTSDGGYILTGNTKSFGAGLNDAWLVKTNSMGDTIWTKTYGGSEDDNSSCVQQTSDGGYIIFGETVSFGPTYWKVWLIKTDEHGDTSWTKLIGENRHYFAESGQEISGGGYIFAGYHKASGAGQEDLWLVKTDASGDTIWTKTYGGNDGELSQSVEQTNDGGYIIAAAYKYIATGDYDCWLVRTDPTGDTIWTKKFGGTDDDHIYSVHQTSDNGFILAGGTRSFGNANNYFDVWLIKTDFSGDTIWTKTYGGTGNDLAEAVEQTLDGGYIVTGYSSLGAWIIKTDSSGDTLWTKSLGWGGGKHIQQTSDGGFIVLVQTFIPSTMNDAYLVKLGPDPNDVEPLEQGNIPDNYILKQNYPNPFNPSTTIEFGIPESQFVTLLVYNLLGEPVEILVDKYIAAGNYKINWDTQYLPTGIYIYTLKASEFTRSNKMILIR